MSLKKLSLDNLQKVQAVVKSALTLPELEDRPQPEQLLEDVEEFPEPNSLDQLGTLFRVGSAPGEGASVPNADGRWFVSAADASAVFAPLPWLQLKPSLRLVTYLYRTDSGGLGATWAVPEQQSTTANLEAALASSAGPDSPPYPDGALLKVMSGVVGDRAPMSFVAASILQRELTEFGAAGNHRSWGHHRFIATIPRQQWKWRMQPPGDLLPKLRLLPDGQAAVEFYTCRVVPPIAIFRHVDQYAAAHYLSKTIDQPVATVAAPIAAR